MKNLSSIASVLVSVASLVVATAGCSADASIDDASGAATQEEPERGLEPDDEVAVVADGDVEGDQSAVGDEEQSAAGVVEVASTADALAGAQKSSTRDDIITHGKQHLGVPYVFGASPSTTKEFDCSSFVKHLYASEANLTLPRTALSQSKQGTSVSLSSLSKGDVIFFKSTTRPVAVDHVGIYAGNNQLLHTYKKGVGVTISSFSATSYWRKHAVSARRFIN